MSALDRKHLLWLERGATLGRFLFKFKKLRLFRRKIRPAGERRITLSR